MSADPIAQAFNAAFAANGRTSVSDAEREEIDRLRSTHPDYDDQEPSWRFMLRAYEGGADYVGDDTLFKHHRETVEDFEDRKARATYLNFCAPLVDFVPEYIFKEAIERTAPNSVSAEFDAFLHDVDGCGTDMSTFMRRRAEDARIFGHTFVFVDRRVAPANIDMTMLSQQRAGELRIGQPYFVPASPLEVLDWVTDEFGVYVYVKRVEHRREFSGGTVRSIERYTEWTETTALISVVDVSDAKSPKIASSHVVEHKWGRVPVEKLTPKERKSNRDLSLSFLQDLAYQNRDVFNQTSLIGEFLARQCFNVLAMEVDSGLPRGDGEDAGKIIGTGNVLEVPKDAQYPAYISPPVEPTAFIQEERQFVIREMYKQAAQDIGSELFAVSNRSGDATKQAFGRMTPPMSRLADVLQAMEKRLFSLWAIATNRTGIAKDIKVAYKDDYGITSVLDFAVQLGAIFNTLRVMSPTFVREQWKRVVREFDGRLPQDVLEQIYKELDETDDDEILGLFGNQSASGVVTAANLQQGATQTAVGSDSARSGLTGDKAASKETLPDKQKQSASAGRLTSSSS